MNKAVLIAFCLGFAIASPAFASPEAESHPEAAKSHEHGHKRGEHDGKGMMDKKWEDMTPGQKGFMARKCKYMQRMESMTPEEKAKHEAEAKELKGKWAKMPEKEREAFWKEKRRKGTSDDKWSKMSAERKEEFWLRKNSKMTGWNKMPDERKAKWREKCKEMGNHMEEKKPLEEKKK